jgi:hypothetical protein
MGGLGALLRRARNILRTEGLAPLLRQGFAFLGRQLFCYENYYLYEYTFKERNEADFLPRIQNFTFKIISTNQQADELAAAGLGLRSYSIINARAALDKGATAFCIFIGGELAHIGWAAMNEEARKLVESPHYYRINFSNKQACTAGVWTNPKYRGKGLMSYGGFKRFQFLIGKGRKSSRSAVNVNNIASQTAFAKFGPKIYAKGRYLKILWWKHWKETPLTQASSE